MPARSDVSALDRIQRALAGGDVADLRRAMLELNEEEERLLTLEMGSGPLQRAKTRARRVRRGGKRGRVVVLPGIMGSMLDVVKPKGDARRVWANRLRLIEGGMGDLELGDDEESAKPGYGVRTAGVDRGTYVPLILELDTEWDVRPAAFDWREDISRSAERLAGDIRAWGRGGPVHIVAHSMGGLVAREMIRLHPDLWESMQDPRGGKAGGRLVMLGTPNHGSYTIPLVLTGQEKTVKKLAFFDIRHNMDEILAIISTFPGSYQMLPSPLIALSDGHGQLYDPKSWNRFPVKKELLKRAHDFHAALQGIVDPERFVYVAGYGKKTPFLLRIERSGKFSLSTTLDGDGRVPHALGLLDGVETLWVDEDHGDLPKNHAVLDGIHELLVDGRTAALEPTRPDRRAAVEVREWLPAGEIDSLDLEALVTPSRGGLRALKAGGSLSREDEIRSERWLLAGYAGSGPVRSVGASEAGSERRPRSGTATGSGSVAASLEVEVVWGDIALADGDIYAVGHYQGVEPQRAELALDRAISEAGTKSKSKAKGGKGAKTSSDGGHRLVITEHTRRGTLRGAVGDVHYFPWDGGAAGQGRVVAVAGMGFPGSFDLYALRRLIRGLALSVSLLPQVKTVCSVLIGSGEGTLSTAEAVRGLIEGIDDAFGDPAMGGHIRKLRVVERDRDRADRILEDLKREIARRAGDSRLSLKPAPRVKAGRGGRVSDEGVLGDVLEICGRAERGRGTPAVRRGVNSILRGMKNESLRSRARDLLKERGEDARVTWNGEEPAAGKVPVRISVLEAGGVFRMAAITETATVAERTIAVDPKLIDEIVAQTNDPEAEPPADFHSFLLKLLVPREFRSVIGDDDTFVFELDRSTAKIHWEMLAKRASGEAGPLGVEAKVARQLRTSYSPPPMEVRKPRATGLRALVVGDPGDPDQGYDLPGARDEAKQVVKILGAQGVEVTALIGAPNASRRGLPSGTLPASRLDVLRQLMRGNWDILHYSGHGDFDPKDPSRVGWLFVGGLLTAGEIGRLDQVPGLIVANACLSGRTSDVLTGHRSVEHVRSEAGLLPSLADEFFHLGVRNYVGTSWEVNDLGAVAFARTFYENLLRKGGGCTVGEAMQAGRKELHENRRNYGKLWAAYQHYGDPNATLS